MSDSGLLSVGEVNELDLDQFLWLFGNVIEKTPEAASYAYGNKPFKNAAHIVTLFSKYLDTLSTEEQESQLRAFPELGTREKMLEESFREHTIAGLMKLNDNDQEELRDNISRYKEKFGFPFVISARENTTNSILDMIKIRLENDKETELRTGIEQVKKIVRLRLCELVWHD